MKNNIKISIRFQWALVITILLSILFHNGFGYAQANNTPLTLEIITTENVKNLQFLTRMSQGILQGDFVLQSDGNIIAASSGSGVVLFDRTAGNQIGLIDIGFSPTALAISPDGKTLAVIYNVPSGRVIDQGISSDFNGREFLPKISFYSLPDGKPTGKVINDLKECGQSNIWALAFTRDGKELVFERKYSVIDRDKRFCALSVTDGNIIHTMEIPTSTESSISPTGNYLAIMPMDKNNQANKVIVYDTKNFKLLTEITFPLAKWPGVMFTRRGTNLAISYFMGESEKVPHTIQFWSLPDGQPGVTIQEKETILNNAPDGQKEESSDFIMSVDVSPDGRWIATGSQNGKIKVWNLKTGKLEKEIGALTWNCLSQVWNTQGANNSELASYVKQVEFSSDGTSLVASEYATSEGQTGQIHAYQILDGKEIAAFYGSHGSEIGNISVDLAFSPDSSQIAFGGFLDGHVEVHNSSDGILAQKLEGHTKTVNQVRFSPTGNLVATASDDNSIRLWDVKTGKALRTLVGHTARVNQIAFSSDGSWLVSGADDNTIRRWNIENGNLVETLQLGNENWRVESLAVLTDGKTVFYIINKYPSPSLGYITKQVLWNTESGKQTLLGDGKILISHIAKDGQTFVGIGESERIIGKLQPEGKIIIISTGIRSPYGNGALASPTLSADNRILISGNFAGLHAYDISKSPVSFIGLIAQDKPIPSYGIQLAISPDGKILAIANSGVIYLLGVMAQ